MLQPATVKNYSLPSTSLVGSQELRMDAGHYSPELLQVLHTLNESGMRMERLADITSHVFIPPRFKRVYVDAEHGIPFLQGSHIVHFQPADLKYLSRSLHRLEQWVIRAGWLLVTCSGTIGRITMCPQEWDGWAASQHILRIIPDEEKCPSGYLCSFLASPLGQVQLTANIYGAVVDELTQQQAEGIMIPLPETDEDWELVRSVDANMREAVVRRLQAVSLVNGAIAGIQPSFQVAQESKQFALPVRHLSSSSGLRMDASHYNPSLLKALDTLEGLRTVRLGEIADVFMPPRFKRVYVEPEHGLPFLQGSHVVHFQPADVKYLSPVSCRNIEELKVKAGWLLVTRSGTVGRVVFCPSEWDEWVASEHIIRIVPNDEERCPSGYLCSFLASSLGQAQLSAHVHGAVVDELTVEQTKSILVPLPDNAADLEKVLSVDSELKKAAMTRTEAASLATRSVESVVRRFGPA